MTSKFVDVISSSKMSALLWNFLDFLPLLQRSSVPIFASVHKINRDLQKQVVYLWRHWCFPLSILQHCLDSNKKTMRLSFKFTILLIPVYAVLIFLYNLDSSSVFVTVLELFPFDSCLDTLWNINTAAIQNMRGI